MMGFRAVAKPDSGPTCRKGSGLQIGQTRESPLGPGVGTKQAVTVGLSLVLLMLRVRSHRIPVTIIDINFLSLACPHALYQRWPLPPRPLPRCGAHGMPLDGGGDLI